MTERNTRYPPLQQHTRADAVSRVTRHTKHGGGTFKWYFLALFLTLFVRWEGNVGGEVERHGRGLGRTRYA